jgi:hypothetical protein
MRSTLSGWKPSMAKKASDPHSAWVWVVRKR